MEDNSLERFDIRDVPEFQKLRDANPNNPNIDSLQVALMYGRAIHWISILDILWPDFEIQNWYTVEVAYIVVNDPDAKFLPPPFYQYIAQTIAMFWRMQLRQKYPSGSWSVTIDDEPEMSVRAEITSRG